MYLSRHQTPNGPRWALDRQFLPASFDLGVLLEQPSAALPSFISSLPRSGAAEGKLLAPVEADQEVWAAGVTYLRSREAREAESTQKDVYARVYESKRPELFFKSVGWRVVGPDMPIRLRRDSAWNVPEPELVLIINSRGEIVGHSLGNDVSSRDIEGENPLYLPQAKVYTGSCALGPGIVLGEPGALRDLPVRIGINRGGQPVFEGETRTSRMKRTPEELAGYLTLELDFPRGVLLFTGTGIVPPGEFTMQRGDRVSIELAELLLENTVADS